MPAHKKQADWTAVRLDYEAGMKPLRQIAAEHALSKSGIDGRAKAEGWTRDLSDRIRARARMKVDSAIADSKASKAKPATEAQIVDANSSLQAGKILGMRRDLGGAREIVASMIAELGAKRFTPEEAKLLAQGVIKIKEITDPLEMMTLANAIIKSLDLGNRAAIMKNLATSLTALIDSERTAFNIDDRTRGANEIVEGLKRLAAMPVD